MAYSRFFGSDIYIYPSTMGYITCSACSVSRAIPEYMFKSINLYNDQEVIDHLAKHRANGDDVPNGLEEEILSDPDRFTPYDQEN